MLDEISFLQVVSYKNLPTGQFFADAVLFTLKAEIIVILRKNISVKATDMFSH
jgi:hypothetical protein